MSAIIDLSDDRPVGHRLGVIVAGWTAVALISALILRGQGLSFLTAVVSSLAWYYPLGAVVWIACYADGQLGLWQRPGRALAIHLAMGVVAIGVWLMVVVAFSRVSVGPDYWQIVFGDVWMWQLLMTSTIYTAGVGLGVLVQSFDREHRHRHRESQLEVLTREAELIAMNAQLQPHFLLNALNSIRALLEEDPSQARRMLERLATLLQSIFTRLDEPFVLLERELDSIRDYLEIECIRFGDRMTFSMHADPDTRQVSLPPFLLQPLVENAVKHGIERHPGAGTIRIESHLAGPRLQISVADTGPAVNDVVTSTPGRGLTLTRSRLRATYGDGATLSTVQRVDGFTATLDLPITNDPAFPM